MLFSQRYSSLLYLLGPLKSHTGLKLNNSFENVLNHFSPVQRTCEKSLRKKNKKSSNPKLIASQTSQSFNF